MNELDRGLPQEQWTVESSDFARVISLSDAMFAFALTLLAVNITLPALDPARVADDLPNALWNLRDEFFIYALAFFIVYAKWNAHRRLVRVLVRYDNFLLTLNMLFLLLIAAMALPANIIGTYGSQPAAVIFFAGYQIAATLFEVFLWHYATYKHRLVAPDLPGAWIRLNSVFLWLVIGVFALSMPVSLISTDAAEYMWLLLIVLPFLSRWFIARARKPSP